MIAPQFSVAPASLFATDAAVLLDKPGRTVAGFGGAFSEKGWQALSALPTKARGAAMAALFGPDGCNFSLCRTPPGASRERHLNLENWDSEQECGVGTNDCHYARYTQAH